MRTAGMPLLGRSSSEGASPPNAMVSPQPAKLSNRPRGPANRRPHGLGGTNMNGKSGIMATAATLAGTNVDEPLRPRDTYEDEDYF